MSEVTRRYATDDTFREVADLLFGGGYIHSAISKANPDGADLHVKGNLAPIGAAEKKKRKRQAQIGYASNVVGIAAGVAGTAAAMRDDRFKEGGKVARKLYKVGNKLPKPISSKGGKAGAALAGGALGLQVANLGGDAVANRVLNRAKNEDTELPTGSGSSRRIRVKKNLKELKENASFPSKGKLTRSSITSAARAKGKGAELVSRGKYKKLPDHMCKSLKTRSRAESVAGHGAVGLGLTGLPMAVKPSKTTAGIAAGGTAAGATYGALKPLTHPKKKVKKNFDVTWEGEISKVDHDKRQVFGWASIVEMNGQPVVDLQGDYISIDEIEKSAYEYVLKSRKGGDMHQRAGEQPLHTSDMIESFLVTPEKVAKMGLPEGSLPLGWWVGYKVHDDNLWNLVKEGKRTGFSIHGRGQRTEKAA